MVVAILACLIDESGRIPREKLNGMKRLVVFAVALLEECTEQLARCSVVSIEMTLVLVAIHFDEVECLGIRTPGNVGEVAVGWVTCFQIEDLARLHIVDAYAHFMACFSRHRVWIGVELCST